MGVVNKPLNIKDAERKTPVDSLWLERLREISDRCVVRPVIDTRSDDELAGYDERGLPAQPTGTRADAGSHDAGSG